MSVDFCYHENGSGKAINNNEAGSVLGWLVGTLSS